MEDTFAYKIIFTVLLRKFQKFRREGQSDIAGRQIKSVLSYEGLKVWLSLFHVHIITAVSYFPSNCGTQCYTAPLYYRNEVRADADQSGPHQFPVQLRGAGLGEDCSTCCAR
jgi:hypothetical protein